MSTILQFENISYYYEEKKTRTHILKDVSFSFNRGKFYTIVGPSGIGKTTTLALASAMDDPKKGKILYAGKNILDTGLTRFRNEKIGIVFQSYYLINYMTALQNVLTAMEVSKSNIKNKRKKALELIEQVGLTEDEAKRNVKGLSGGQQQRVAIARALATDPTIILADEPTGNLDENTAMGIIQLLKNLAHDNNKCVIVVSHSNQVTEESDVILELKNFQLYKV